MIKVYVRAIPSSGACKPRVWERRLWLCREPDILGCVGSQLRAIYPEAKERVRIRAGIVDEYLRNIHITNYGFVIGCCSAGRCWYGLGGCCRVGIRKSEACRVYDLV